MAKIKTCKGTGKASDFDGCGEELPFVIKNGMRNYNAQYGLGRVCGCYNKWLISTEKGKEILQKARIKGKKEVEKKERAKKREEKSLNQDWSKKLQEEVNKIVRLIDKGLLCLARNQRGQIHAGHVYARGGNSSIKYNLHNIHRQCAQSNHHQNDDGLLREGVVREYGQDYMEFISELRQAPKLEYMNHEYRDLTEKAKIIVKDLTDKDKVYSKSERIELRNRINKELAIYDLRFCVFDF